MIRIFADLPVQAKLATIFMVICSSLVLLMACIFTVDKVYSFRRSMVENHSMLAETIAKNSTAALVFDDAITAQEVLSALRVVQDVETATIYTAAGEPFASYHKNVDLIQEEPQLIAKPMPLGDDANNGLTHQFQNNYLDIATPIILENNRLGYLTIRANLKHLTSRLFASISIVVVLIIVLGLLAQLVSVKLHRFIARPLVGLLDVMVAVKDEKVYSYRAERFNNDELGELTDGFNSMLAEIEKREEELVKHRENLEGLVEKRTKELVLANQQLQVEINERKLIQDKLDRAQRMEAIGTLAAGVAHDLNNILSGVVSYPELLMMQLNKDDEMYGPLATIQTSGIKAAAIVQDLLTLSRRTGSMLDVVNLVTVIEEYLVSAEFKKLMAHHLGVKIVREFDSGVGNIKGSSVHLSKAVMNLITNSAEAIEAEGTVTIRLKDCYLDRPVHGYKDIREGDYIHLQVEDTGHGIHEEDLKFIFEPFYTKKKMGMSGTGLGMAVVWGTIEDHEGYIDVVSSPGQGAAFDIYLPATREVAKQKELEEIHSYRGGGEKILVVDDVKAQRIIASDILRMLEYSVDTVGSGEEAITYLRNKSVDLLILDMIMDPGIDGIETYRQALAINPRQRALIASGYSEANKVETAKELGVFVYLQKPYTVAGLAKVVREELDRVI